MSRKLKISRQSPLTNQPPKPSDYGHYEIEVLKTEESKEPISHNAAEGLIFNKRSLEPEKSKMDDHPSEAQQGLALWAGELYSCLRPPQSGLSSLLANLLKDTKSAPKTPTSKQGVIKGFNSFSSDTRINKGPKLRKYRSVAKPKKIDIKAQLFKILKSRNPGAISPQNFVYRLLKFGEFGDQVAVVLAIYLQRALLNMTGLRPHHFHKLTVGCLVIAFKYLTEDSFWGFDELGFICGVKPDMLEEIEELVLSEVLKYRIFVNFEEYRCAKEMLISVAESA